MKRKGEAPKRVARHADRRFAGMVIVARALPAGRPNAGPGLQSNTAHAVNNVATDDASISAVSGLGSILWFDPRRGHSSVPTAKSRSRRAQGLSRLAALFCGHPKGLALIGPSTAACLIGSGLLKP
jgi:hypothetical protein